MKITKALFSFACVAFLWCGNAALPGAQETPDSARPFTVTIDMIADAFYMRSFSGDYSARSAEFSDSPYRYQGDGDIKSFQTSAFDDGLNGRVQFEYAGQKLGGLLQLKADTAAGNGNINLALSVGDWDAWIRIGKFVRVSGGNTGKRGQVERYHNYDDFLRTKVDSLGIMVPVFQVTPPYVSGNNLDTIASFPYGYATADLPKGFVAFFGSDTNDLFMPAGATVRPSLNFLLDGFLPIPAAPVTLSASVGGLFEKLTRPFGHPWEVSNGGTFNDYDKTYDPKISSRMNFGFRAEGAKIADMVTIALTYKYADTLLVKTKAENPNDAMQEYVSNHAFGVYANITPLPGLGVSVGYSGLVKQWINPDYEATDVNMDIPALADSHWGSQYREVVFPYYSGIDLRASYTGISKLTVTTNHNISFATVQGLTQGSYGKDRAEGWFYNAELNYKNDPETLGADPNRSERYLGLYNSIGAKYLVIPDLTADLQLANQCGIFTLDWENDAIQSVTNIFGLYAGVTALTSSGIPIPASLPAPATT